MLTFTCVSWSQCCITSSCQALPWPPCHAASCCAIAHLVRHAIIQPLARFVQEAARVGQAIALGAVQRHAAVLSKGRSSSSRSLHVKDQPRGPSVYHTCQTVHPCCAGHMSAAWTATTENLLKLRLQLILVVDSMVSDSAANRNCCNAQSTDVSVSRDVRQVTAERVNVECRSFDPQQASCSL